MKHVFTRRTIDAQTLGLPLVETRCIMCGCPEAFVDTHPRGSTCEDWHKWIGDKIKEAAILESDIWPSPYWPEPKQPF